MMEKGYLSQFVSGMILRSKILLNVLLNLLLFYDISISSLNCLNGKRFIIFHLRDN